MRVYPRQPAQGRGRYALGLCGKGGSARLRRNRQPRCRLDDGKARRGADSYSLRFSALYEPARRAESSLASAPGRKIQRTHYALRCPVYRDSGAYKRQLSRRGVHAYHAPHDDAHLAGDRNKRGLPGADNRRERRSGREPDHARNSLHRRCDLDARIPSAYRHGQGRSHRDIEKN